MKENVYLTAGDIDLLLKIIQDWTCDLDLSISENKTLFEEVEDLYNHLCYEKRRMIKIKASLHPEG